MTDCKCPVHERSSAECYCMCQHDGTDPCDQPERWLPIPGYEDLYQVSDRGRVWSTRGRHRYGGILKGWINSMRYPSVGLCPSPGVNKRIPIHRLVMLAFVGPRPEGMLVRHLDGDPTHNVLSNLRYGTYSENGLDAVRHGTDPRAAQTHCIHGHEFTAENTRWAVRSSSGHLRRYCIECNRIHVRQTRARERTAAATA